MINDRLKLPGFALGNLSNGTADSLPADARPLWEDLPDLMVWGNLTHRLQVGNHELGRVALIGDCFPDEIELSETLDRALKDRQPDLLTHFPGAYTTILVEADRTTVLRDVAGTAPVYFGEGVTPVVSSSASAVVGHKGLQPNLPLVSAFLTMLGAAEGALSGNSSCFEGVARLKGGQGIQVSSEKPEVFTYEPLTPDPHATLQDGARQLRTTLQTSISARRRRGLPESADLSGGKDSSSMVALLLRNMAPDSTLPVFFRGSLEKAGGDGACVRRMIQDEPRLKLDQFDASTAAEVHITEVPQDEKLTAGIGEDSWRALMAQYYRIPGEGTSRLHFTGHGGDEVAGARGHYLADIFGARNIKRFLVDGLHYARVSNASALGVWRTMFWLHRHGLEGALTNAADKVAGLVPMSAHEDPLGMVMPWSPEPVSTGHLTEQARHMLADFLRGSVDNARLPQGQGIGDFMNREGIACSGDLKDSNDFYTQAGVDGLLLQSPFLDNEVVRAVCSVSGAVKGDPRHFKLILEEALRGIAPDYILERNTKDEYDEFLLRLRLNLLQGLRSRIDDSHLAKMNIIDPAQVHRSLDLLETASSQTMWALNQILITELWLDSLDRAGHPIRAMYRQETTVAQSTKVADNKSRVTVKQALPDSNFAIQEFVHAVASPAGNLVLFNERTDSYHPLTATQSHILRAIAATNNIEKTVAILQDIYPTVDPTVIDRDVRHDLNTFLQLGLIIPIGTELQVRELPVTAQTPDFVSTELASARPAAEEYVPLKQRTLAAAVFAGNLLLEKVMPGRRLGLLRQLQHRWANRPATQTEAQQALVAVQTLPYIGQIACRESPYTAALALALQRRAVDYHIGVSFSPASYHAWINAEGEPVRTSQDGQVTGSFQSFFRT